MNPLDRSASRLAAVQALYQMEVAGTSVTEILPEFERFWIEAEIEGEQYRPAEVAFFRDIVAGVVRDQLALDRMVNDVLTKGWPLKRVEAVLRAILRAGAYELKSRPDIPARVAIKEYVDLAGAFFDRDEAGMANAVLDALAHALRQDEFLPRAVR
jgi:N utilization substance protein B